MDGWSRQLPHLNSLAEFFEKWKIVFMVSGEIFIFTLKISITKNCKFL